MLSILHLLHPLIFTMTLYGYDTRLTSFYNGKKKLVSSETGNQTQVLCPSTSCWKIHTASSHTKQVLLRVTPWLLPKPANEQRIFITLKIHYSGFPVIHLIKSFLSQCQYLASLPQSLSLFVFMDRSTSRIIFIWQAPITLVSPDH